jgi:hypothetical protein
VKKIEIGRRLHLIGSPTPYFEPEEAGAGEYIDIATARRLRIHLVHAIDRAGRYGLYCSRETGELLEETRELAE